ncbi:uncharacterized protein LOC143599703 [Bidens hawaiensis]|uniref:uncharacterized protein LOC143599703 n=1 Tax=Bidens hawaiensis TaxID=980011 RepID=UPI00404A13CB
MGTSNKPPKLLRMEDYPSWADKFETYVQALNYETWNAVEEEYIIPKNENGDNYRLSQIEEHDKPMFLKEKKMLNLFQQAIKAEIFQLLQHNGTCYSIWQALLNKDRGNLDMRKSKMALLKKEFEIFTQVKGESVAQLIELYCHLVNEMKRLCIDKPDYEYIDKLADALPEEWGTLIMIQQSNPVAYDRLNLARFIEKLEAHELELRKKQKMKSTAISQDVGLYYKGSQSGVSSNPKILTTFYAEQTVQAFVTSVPTTPQYGISYSGTISVSQASNPNTQDPDVLQCNIAVNLKKT